MPTPLTFCRSGRNEPKGQTAKFKNRKNDELRDESIEEYRRTADFEE
jgi:hypothetical protein